VRMTGRHRRILLKIAETAAASRASCELSGTRVGCGFKPPPDGRISEFKFCSLRECEDIGRRPSKTSQRANTHMSRCFLKMHSLSASAGAHERAGRVQATAAHLCLEKNLPSTLTSCAQRERARVYAMADFSELLRNRETRREALCYMREGRRPGRCLQGPTPLNMIEGDSWKISRILP
jgi:hypothetical protein